MRHEGTVQKYDRQFGIGYILKDDSIYYFNHRNILMDGFRYLNVGDRVTFSLGVRGDNLVATEITLKP